MVILGMVYEFMADGDGKKFSQLGGLRSAWSAWADGHLGHLMSAKKKGERNLKKPMMHPDFPEMGMDQYLLILFLGGWTSIYQLFWCSPGVQGFDTLPNMAFGQIPGVPGVPGVPDPRHH